MGALHVNTVSVFFSVLCTYVGQGRTDGAICGYTEGDKNAYLKRLKEEGVTNIEMEATIIGSMCNAVGE